MRSIGAPDPPYEQSVPAGAPVSLRVRGSGKRLGEAGWKGAADHGPGLRIEASSLIACAQYSLQT